MYLQDGYKLIRAEQLIAALAALNTGTISFRSLRAYLGCFELLAIREAAERSTTKLRKTPLRRFLTSELGALLEAEADVSVSRELSQLKRAELLSFSEAAITVSDAPTHEAELQALLGGRGARRLIPVPRRVLRFLAACSKPALVKTIIAYLLRGLSLDKDGRIKSTGTAKVSWICKLCQISERAARSARAELIRLGWITKDTSSFQRKLNRDGAYFVINTAWNRVFKQFAPPKAEKGPEFAPPLKRLETPSDSKNQKLGEPDGSGFCGKERGGKAPFLARSIVTEHFSDAHLPQANSASQNFRASTRTQRQRPSEKMQGPRMPDIRNIQPEDLRRVSTLKTLYHQAISAQWLQDSEASFRNFVAAAVRGTRVQGDAVRVFVGIVRRQLWHHISHEQEERARVVIRNFQEKVGANKDVVSEPIPNKVSEVIQELSASLGMG